MASAWFLDWYWTAFSNEIDWTLHTLYDGCNSTLRRLEQLGQETAEAEAPPVTWYSNAVALAQTPTTPLPTGAGSSPGGGFAFRTSDLRCVRPSCRRLPSSPQPPGCALRERPPWGRVGPWVWPRGELTAAHRPERVVGSSASQSCPTASDGVQVRVP